MKEMRFKVFFLFLFTSVISGAQIPVADFTVQASSCIGELFQISNSSVGDRYEWDFCQGDLLLTPTAQVGALATGNITLGIDVVFDGTTWFGFVTDAANNTIVRLDYGTDLNSTPAITSLGAIFSTSVIPYDIKLVHHNGEWFGFVYGVGQLISRLDFGSSLTNMPVSNMIVSGSGTTSGLDVVYGNGNWYVFFTQNFSAVVIQLSDIKSIPAPSDIKTTVLTDTNIRLGDIKILKSGNNWYGYSVCYATKKLFKLSFGSDPFSIAGITEIAGGAIGSFTPYGIDGGHDNGLYTLFVSTLEGSLVRVNLGTDLTVPPAEEISLGTFGILNNTLKITLVKTGSTWRAFSPGYTSGNVFNITFPNSSCSANQISSGNDEPELSYSSSGTKHITLRSFVGGAYSETSKSILVQGLNAPLISIESTGNCISSAVQFTYSSDQSATSVLWDFQNGQTSTVDSPTFLFSTPDNHEVSFKLTTSNGCSNFTKTEVSIYNPPSASFLMPSGLTCTNNEILFTNTTPDNFNGQLTYQWLIDGTSVSTQRDLRHDFSSIGDKDIKLTASIPGCSSSLTQNFNVQSVGPSVDFTMAGVCQNDPVEFTSSITGQFNNLQWTFGDGAISTLDNPTHNYTSIGNYDVQLTAVNASGCQNSATKSLTIRSQPQPDFSLALPPFSCAGSASQFSDLTPSMPDSNVNGWAWTFGDAAQGTSTIKNATYSYSQAGDYLVALAVTTNFGCTASIEKTVTISPSPTAAFTNAAACMSQGTLFTDASGTDIKAWLWTMQSSTYTTKNPTHIFTATGQQTVTLAVTANNNCVSQIEKSITVPVPVAVNFSAVSTCATLPATFTETTLNGDDPAVSWSWDFGGATGNGSPIQHTFASVGTYPVKLSSTRQSGCTYLVIKSIAIIQPPVANFTVPFTSGPAPLTMGFTNTSTQASSYLWKFNDSDNSTSTAFSPSFVFDELGTYPVELVASNAVGCSDSFVKEIQVVVPNMNAAITDFVLSPNPDGTWKGIVTIENRSNMAITNPEVFIDLAGRTRIKEKVTATLQPNQIYTQQISTDFIGSNLSYVCAEVRLPNDAYAFDDSQCATLTNESIALAPYPNPVSDELVLNWINQGDEQLQVTIFSSAGQVVMDQEYSPLLQDLNQVRIDVRDLKSGIYYVSFKSATWQSNHRFAVVR